MPSDANDWCLIESDPGVFTELIGKFGVRDVEVSEIYELDDLPRTIESLPPVYGFVFLFNISKAAKSPETGSESGSGGSKDTKQASEASRERDSIFFASQVIQNACATLAILNILLNNSAKVDLGPHLSEFLSFTAAFTPELRGLTLTNSELIREAHNSFAKADMFEEITEDQPKVENSGELFHFVGYLKIDGFGIFELDGLKPAPSKVSRSVHDDLGSTLQKVLKERIEKYGNELRFNLMAITRSRLSEYKAQKTALVDTGVPVGDESLRELTQLIQSEEFRLERFRRENARRRHGYIPLIYQLLSAMAQTQSTETGGKSLLDSLIDR